MRTLTKLSLFALSLMPVSLLAQRNKITSKDAKEISYQAKVTVRGLEGLYNYISFNDNTQSELEEVLQNSYSPSRNQIFYNKNIIVEDNLDPESGLKNSKDVPLAKHLSDLDLAYVKTADPSVVFNNIAVSSVKQGEYLYVLVRFDENFSSTFKPKGSIYPLRSREATLRVDSIAPNKWQTLIVGVTYWDKDAVNDEDKNVILTSDTSSNAAIVSQEEFLKDRESFILAREAEEKRKKAVFDEYVALANNYVNSTQFKEALELYDKAKELQPLVPALDKKILDARRLMAKYTFENFKGQGDKAKGERNYQLAIAKYQKALSLKPEASSMIAAEVEPLSRHLALVALPANKLESGQLEGALEACEKILKENKKARENFPELFLTKGKTYQKMYERLPADAKFAERALENYNLAIQYFPNYLEARMSRGLFLAKVKKDYAGAISDYDLLTLNAMDDCPEKPVYFATKAQWKDLSGNASGAIADYETAIALNAAWPKGHFYKAELLYRLKKFTDAQKSFDVAISLDKAFRDAFYYRGLNYVALKDYDKAGADFSAMEKLKAEAAQLATVDSISACFFTTGSKLVLDQSYAKADTAYNIALKIRSCNANALHGKADIRFRIAEGAKVGSDAAKLNYLESIEFNRQASLCNPNFSDAFFVSGLSYSKIANHKKALDSYSEAVRSDSSNYPAFIRRGNTYELFENYPKAVEDYSRSIALLKINYEQAKKSNDKTLPKTLLKNLSQSQSLQGRALYYNQEYKNAMMALNLAIGNDELNAEAFYYKGLVNRTMGELASAFSNYKDAIKIMNDAKFNYAYGDALFANKNYEESSRQLRTAISLDSNAVVKNRYYLLGRSLYRAKLYKEAIVEFNQYEQDGVMATDSTFYNDYGFTNLYNDKDGEAMKCFSAGLKQNSADGRGNLGMACTYAKMGQFEKSFEFLEKAFAARSLSKEELKLEEKAFLVKMVEQKANKTKYNQLKKTYLEN